jgi:CRP/FNR family transcriptional regulator/CRP/FNR family cyclic AMP-dependent transcriptional regulator
MAGPVLTRLALFADLTEAEIESISRATRRRRYGKRSLIHASGAMGADFYVIESGRVMIQLPSDRGHELTLRLLWPGDFFGELSLVDAEPWYGDAIALDDCQLLLLAKRDFLDVLDKYPSVSRRLLLVICQRLRHNARFAQDLAFLDVPTRLARALVTLAGSEAWGWTGDGEPHDSLAIEITQSALAAHVGATRESVNKWLGYYERRGYISRKRDRIVVLKMEELRSQAQAE